MENSPYSSETPPEPDDETLRLIGEVAKRHGIVLGSGDPLCIVLTVLELFLDRYLSRLDGMFQAHQAVSFEALDRASDAAKAIAEQLITSRRQLSCQDDASGGRGTRSRFGSSRCGRAGESGNARERRPPSRLDRSACMDGDPVSRHRRGDRRLAGAGRGAQAS